MAPDGVLTAAVLAAVAGPLVLRLSWGRPQRSVPLNAAGWLLLAAALGMGWAAGGAWGAALATMFAMGTALAGLAVAAMQPQPARRAVRARRAGTGASVAAPASLSQRLATFALVTLAGLVAAVAIALATRWIALLAGAGEGNANVLALFAGPLGWAILTCLVLMSDDRKRQIALLVVPVAAALPALAWGSFA